MAEETITEAPGKESGADSNAGILSEEDLALSFAERVESETEEKPTEAEAEEATEAPEAEAVEVEDDVLSKSISQDDDETDEEESEEEESEEEESAEEETESPAVGRLLKQVGKLTARAKGAEEEVEAMKAEIQTLKTQGPDDTAQATGSPVMDDVRTLADLEKVRQEALSAKKWALRHLGKDYVESDGKEYDGDQIREIFAAADEYLMEKIPARGQFLSSQSQWSADALATFPWLESKEGELYDLYLQIRGSDQYAGILDSLPNGDFVGATLARGIKATQEEQATQAKPKKKKALAKPPPSQEGDVAPPVQSKKARSQARKNKALGTGIISEGQLAAFLTE